MKGYVTITGWWLGGCFTRCLEKLHILGTGFRGYLLTRCPTKTVTRCLEIEEVERLEIMTKQGGYTRKGIPYHDFDISQCLSNSDLGFLVRSTQASRLFITYGAYYGARLYEDLIKDIGVDRLTREDTPHIQRLLGWLVVYHKSYMPYTPEVHRLLYSGDAAHRTVKSCLDKLVREGWLMCLESWAYDGGGLAQTVPKCYTLSDKAISSFLTRCKRERKLGFVEPCYYGNNSKIVRPDSDLVPIEQGGKLK